MLICRQNFHVDFVKTILYVVYYYQATNYTTIIRLKHNACFGYVKAIATDYHLLLFALRAERVITIAITIYSAIKKRSNEYKIDN